MGSDEFDSDGMLPDMTENLRISDGLVPSPGGPFSALIPSMWPQDILMKLGQPDDPNYQPDYR